MRARARVVAAVPAADGRVRADARADAGVVVGAVGLVAFKGQPDAVSLVVGRDGWVRRFFSKYKLDNSLVPLISQCFRNQK